MKSLRTELEKVKELLNKEEIIDNKNYISLYTLNKVVEENLSFLNKYNNLDEFLDTLKKDIKEYRGNIFSKNRKFMKYLKPSLLSIYIDKYFDDDWTSTISVLFQDKRYYHAFDGGITVKKKKDVKDIIIDVRYSDKKITENEKIEIIRFISDKYYNFIINTINNMESIIELMSSLPKKEQDRLGNSVFFYHFANIARQNFKYDFINIKLETNVLGQNKIDIEFSDKDINDVFTNKLLKPVELIDIKNEHKDLLLKRVGIDIDELNGFYKKIVLDSQYYKNLSDIKRLEKKPN